MADEPYVFKQLDLRTSTHEGGLRRVTFMRLKPDVWWRQVEPDDGDSGREVSADVMLAEATGWSAQ